MREVYLPELDGLAPQERFMEERRIKTYRARVIQKIGAIPSQSRQAGHRPKDHIQLTAARHKLAS